MIIKLNVPSVYQCEGVTLVAGENEVDDKKAKKFMANKLVKADFDNGTMEEVRPKQGRKPKAESTESTEQAD